ncbi:uncharacterized protein LOC129740115 [Uranotaenia lowii]|uniref:uncharacterized protein LOC129740115 n=1 Tax=Uranotaenia lowii TaxID=190385 RepID=UPI0024796A87|nr:uncharacterized protein LOC129740115 [Uranotaenia lowii]
MTMMTQPNRGAAMHSLALFLFVTVSVLEVFFSANVNGENRDFVFPVLNEKAIGDACRLDRSQQSQTGTCRRIGDCDNFKWQVRQRSFNILQSVCYFEVRDPVICCADDPSGSGSYEQQQQNAIEGWSEDFERRNEQWT